MGWQELRERLVYMAMSAFVVWHAMAIMIAPASDNSALSQSLRRVFNPYLSLFRLNSKWDFYAPNVARGHQLRYTVERTDGDPRILTPADSWNWYHPGYWWFRSWDDAVIAFPDRYADRAIAALCRRHADLRPTAITLQLVQQQNFGPADHLAGRHPLDAEFVVESILKQAPCPA